MLPTIGITGPAGVGKTTTARAIVVAEPRYQRIHVAEPLKEMLRAFYWSSTDLSPSEIERRIDGDLKRRPCPYLCQRTPTEAQQWLGTEWGRDLVGEDLWLDASRRRAERVIALGGGVVNESVRFENEAAAIRAMAGFVIRLEGRGGLAGDAGAHVSEGGVTADATVVVDAPPAEIAARCLAIAGVG